MSVSKFYEIEFDKLNIEFDKIALFTKHPSTIGIYRERVLKDYLRNFIPGYLSFGTGFVYNNDINKNDEIYSSQTKQIDCLVYDEKIHTPYLKTDDFVIIKPESLYAGIEIKSTLTFYKEYSKVESSDTVKYPFTDASGKRYCWAGTLVDALVNMKSIHENTYLLNKDFYKAIFAYTMNFKFQNLYEALDLGELQKQLSILHLYELPTYICIPNNCLIYFSRMPFTMNENVGFDPYQSEISVLESVQNNRAFPLQFFTNSLKIQVDHKLSKKIPDKSGLFTSGKGDIKYWGHHFQLNSEEI